MEITALLIEPTLDQIEKELQELANAVSQGEDLFSHNQELLVKVRSLLSDRVDLKNKIGIFNPQSREAGVIPISFYQELRRLKRETRFARRTFLKIKSNELRFEKMAARRNDVSTVAA